MILLPRARVVAIEFLRWAGRQHWTVKALVLLALIFPVGIPVSVFPPVGRWWDRLVDEAFP